MVDFYDLAAGRVRLAGGELAGFGDVHERAIRNGARHGTPVIVHSGGRIDGRVNLFFRTGAMAGARPSTWRRYAFALAVWLEFLDASSGRGWDSATVRDVEAFKDWRLTDVRNGDRVAPASFDADRAALNSFYGWASARYGLVNPVAPVASGGRRRGSGALARGGVDAGLAGACWGGQGSAGRDGLRPASSRRRQVKWMLRPAFERWRDVGLRGYGLDGLRREGWRAGGCEDRDVCFVDGLYGTGLRLTEWASVLDVEVAGSAAGGRMRRAWLAAACAKGGRQGRVYRIPRSVVAGLEGYLDPVEGSRAQVIARARREGRYERLTGVRLVTGYNAQSRVLHLAGEDGPSHLPADALGPDERRLLFRGTSAGLEPLALWLTPSGMPKRPSGWEDTFQAANARVAAACAASDRSEQGRGDEGEVLFCRPHMLRHSFCLKWFSILSVVWELRLEGFTTGELKDLRAQFGDIWFQLAALMGHASPEITRGTYLEPFTSLQVDYLMALLDEDEKAGVDALVRAIAADCGRVLTGGDAGR